MKYTVKDAAKDPVAWYILITVCIISTLFVMSWIYEIQPMRDQLAIMKKERTIRLQEMCEQTKITGCEEWTKNE